MARGDLLAALVMRRGPFELQSFGKLLACLFFPKTAVRNLMRIAAAAVKRGMA